jgi:hypothetical protein
MLLAALIASSMVALADPARPAPESLVSPARLMDSIRALPTKRAAFADEEHKDGLRKTEAILVERLKDLGYTPVLHEIDFMGSGNERDPALLWHNIIVDIPGKSAAKEVLIFGAHFDAVPFSPGADDNGTGVACLLEAARLLKDVPMQRTVRLIFFNLEEVGLIGARAYAVDLRARIDAGEETAVGMVSLDMLGFYSDKPGSQKSPFEGTPIADQFQTPDVADFIGMGGVLRHRRFSQAFDRAMKEAEPALKTVVVDFLPIAPPDLLRSDHAPFLAINVPAVILSDTANFRNPHYHRPTDTIETIDEAMFARTVRGVIGAMHRLAGPVGGEKPELLPPTTGKPAAKPAPNPSDRGSDPSGAR